ncbi:MAG: hypothetical protein R3E09_05285 [Novosphingobium sp.]
MFKAVNRKILFPIREACRSARPVIPETGPPRRIPALVGLCHFATTDPGNWNLSESCDFSKWGKREQKEATMTAYRFRCSRPHEWIVPRPHLDAHQRFQTYGPIQPMERPGFLARLLGKR